MKKKLFNNKFYLYLLIVYYKKKNIFNFLKIIEKKK
jgi:hypothetical protein